MSTFDESFEEFSARTERATCSCSSAKKPYPWDHAPGCLVGVAYAEWTSENTELWARLRASPAYDPAKIEKLVQGFRA